MSSAALKLDEQPHQPYRHEHVSLTAKLIAPQEWDDLIVNFEECTHEQSQCNNSQRWPAEQLEHIAFYRGDDLVAAALVRLMPLPLLKTGLAVCKWGPLWRKRNTHQGQLDILTFYESLHALQEIYANQRGWFLSIFPRADPDFGELEEQILRDCQFRGGESLTSPNRYFVNCEIDLAQQRTSLAQKWRYNLKKAEKIGLSCRIVPAQEGYQAFMKLYNEMLERKGFHDSSGIEALEGLYNSPQEELRPLIFLVEKDDKMLAGGVIDISGDRAIYLFGATSNDALPWKAGYILHWEIIKKLTANPAIRWYDLGGADVDSDLHQFKRGFVGKQGKIAVTPPYYHYAARKWIGAIGFALYFIRRTKGKLEYDLHNLTQRISRILRKG